MTLSELAKATFNYAQQGQEENDLSNYQLKGLYADALSLYNEAYQILKLEPRFTPEAMYGLQLATKMEEINIILGKIKTCS